MKPYDIHAPKKPINLSINSDLLQKSRDLNLNLSKEFELHLTQVIQQKLEEQWRTENKIAIEEYNKSIQKRNLFSDEWRRF